jgi:hypothetical protein
MCILIGDREPPKESELMTMFAKFQNTDLEDIVDEEVEKQSRKMMKSTKAVHKLNVNGDTIDSDEDDDDDDDGVTNNKAWKQLRTGGLAASLAVENKEKHRLRVKMHEEAKLLAAICYQNGEWTPLFTLKFRITFKLFLFFFCSCLFFICFLFSVCFLPKYTIGMYLPPDFGAHANDMQSKSVNLWSVKK